MLAHPTRCHARFCPVLISFASSARIAPGWARYERSYGLLAVGCLCPWCSIPAALSRGAIVALPGDVRFVRDDPLAPRVLSRSSVGIIMGQLDMSIIPMLRFPIMPLIMPPILPPETSLAADSFCR